MEMKRNSLEKNAGGLCSLIKQTAVFLSVVSLCSYQVSAKESVKKPGERQTEKQQVRVTLGNFAAGKTNALEFTRIFKGSVFQKSYEKLKAVGQEVSCKYEKIPDRDKCEKLALNVIIPPKEKGEFIKFLGDFYAEHDIGNKQKALKKANIFYEKYGDEYVSDLIFNQEKIFNGEIVELSQVDKVIRENGINLYSPMCGTEIKKKDVTEKELYSTENELYSPEKASGKWLESLIPLKEENPFKNTAVEKDDLNTLPVQLMLMEAFNLAIIKGIAENGLFDDLSKVRHHFYNSPLGNMWKKAGLYGVELTRNDPHAICVNEAHERLVESLKKHYIPVRKPKNSSHASRLLIKRDAIQEAKVVQLEEYHIKNYLPALKDPDLANQEEKVGELDKYRREKNSRYLTVLEDSDLVKKIGKHTLGDSDEIAIAIVKFKNIKSPVALLCSHAGPKGEGSLAAVVGFKNLIDEYTRSSNTIMEKMKDKAGDLYHRASSKIREKIGGKSCFEKKSSLDACSSKSESWHAEKIVAIAMQDSNTSDSNMEKISLQTFLEHNKGLEFTSIWGNKIEAQPFTTDKTRTYLQTQPEKAMKPANDQSDIISVMGLNPAFYGNRHKLPITWATPANKTLTLHNPSDHSIIYATLKVQEEGQSTKLQEEVQPPMLERR